MCDSNIIYKELIEIVAQKGDNAIIEGLVEDAMFESFVSLPTAIFAEILWNPNQNVNELISDVAKYSCVKFANL